MSETSAADAQGPSALLPCPAPPDPSARLAPFNPSSDSAIASALALADLRPEDTLTDLGCGDGRVLLAAARRVGCRCVGYEYDPVYFGRAQQAVQGSGLVDRVTLVMGDCREADLSATTVLFLYLLPEGLRTLDAAIHRCFDSMIFSIHTLKPLSVAELSPGVKVFLYRKEAQ